MSVRRWRRRDPKTGQTRDSWMVDVDFEHPDGRRERIRKVSPVQTRRGAEEYERQLRQDVLMGRYGIRKEVPTFDEWWNGRYWDEWVIGRRNKAATVESKRSNYKVHLKAAFGSMKLDEIKVAEIARFRASLVKRGLSDKSVNNILATLSKALHYAADVELIPKAPKVGLFKVERAEIEWWELEEYRRILDTARAEEPTWFVAVCLAGEAGLRIGEIRALKWREHLDLVAGTITVSEQTRKGITGTPKGGRRRVVPMSSTLIDAVKALSVVRTGYVVRNLDGKAMNDGQTSHAIRRILRKAGLPERGWHSLRHSFGTHAALFGVNPWRLQAWMGHNRIDETMLYVHVASSHQRPLPTELTDAGARESDPDRRVLAMLAARARVGATATRRQHDAAPIGANEKGPNQSAG